MSLRQAHHPGYTELVNAMMEHAAEQTAKMLQAPPDMLMKAQGMAIATNEMAKLFAEAPKYFEKAQQFRGR